MKKLYFWLSLVAIGALLLIAANGDLSEGTAKIINLVVAFLVGILGTHPINWLKKAFNLDGVPALLVAYLFSAAVGVFGLWISGQLFAMSFTWENAVAIAGVFLSAAKLAYERSKA